MSRKSKQTILPFKYYEQLKEHEGKSFYDISNLKYYYLNGLTHSSNNSRSILPEVIIYIKELQTIVDKGIEAFNIKYKRRPDEYDIGNIWKATFDIYPLVKRKNGISTSDGQVTSQYIKLDVYRAQVLKITTKFPVDGERNLTVLFKYKNMYLKNEMYFKDIPDSIMEGDQILMFGNWYITLKSNLAFSCSGIAKCDSVSARCPISEYTGVHNVVSRNFIHFPRLQQFNEVDIIKCNSSDAFDILISKTPFYACIMTYDGIFDEFHNLTKIANAKDYEVTLADFSKELNVNKII